MPVPPVTREAITEALNEFGPMSVPEIAEHLAWSRNRVNTCLTTARANHPGKFFKIVSYRMQQGVQGREIPVYAAQAGPDRRRPAFGAEHTKIRGQEYARRNRARAAVARKRRRGMHEVNPWSGLMPIGMRATANIRISIPKDNA
ncbi:hypothetical protein CBP36_19585 (plasmid) [Acidovorax carolinensis]|jgi:hypothetical protein|uniref:DNA-binding protein n=1 Tax=Acidovorax carolinensis TaxID=553814 RepID=A0A240UI50_9BURK|nr:hypothetical protein [Acidovorax carolinensis]ART57110.1 hypothetical protein CBP35_19540 [Acidovorax carolinensis]ART61171.1 hypothetical protein CBP36_19585 [Acidovorax carolinensis]